ncbi:MAG TPA: hypothetical protein PKC99_17905 [Anaerolineales bacterium]|nr:hypothetical protein [Chloroflexota bacterium]WKZ52869.1 MAG: hypothetical protein QY324_08555 [Anaerolineales bacterium]HMN00882.1 hypothetical protein [Anaerolineales bacterium]
MKLPITIIIILATSLSSCASISQQPFTSPPSPTDILTSTLAPTSTSTAILEPSPTTIATAYPILETGLPPSPTATLNATHAARQESIKAVIQAYFELRYRLLSVSPPANIQQDVFGELVSSGSDARDFLITETAKLAVERKWYELNKLRYAKYEYTLMYKNFMFDASAQTATVSLYEYFDIICERAIESNSQNPSSCAIGELTHEIILRNENNQWKIISDTYRDAWWRQFRKPGLTTDEILHNIELKMQKLKAMPSPTP